MDRNLSGVSLQLSFDEEGYAQMDATQAKWCMFVWVGMAFVLSRKWKMSTYWALLPHPPETK